MTESPVVPTGDDEPADEPIKTAPVDKSWLEMEGVRGNEPWTGAGE